MPTYEYRCKDCSHTFDAVQSFTDDALTECPVCAGSLRKVFGNVGITFKGSGFYRTDSRSASSPESKSTNGDSGRSDDRTSSDNDRTRSSQTESSTKEGADTKSSSKPEPSGSGSGSGTKSGAASSAKPGSDKSASSTPA